MQMQAFVFPCLLDSLITRVVCVLSLHYLWTLNQVLIAADLDKEWLEKISRETLSYSLSLFLNQRLGDRTEEEYEYTAGIYFESTDSFGMNPVSYKSPRWITPRYGLTRLFLNLERKTRPRTESWVNRSRACLQHMERLPAIYKKSEV